MSDQDLFNETDDLPKDKPVNQDQGDQDKGQKTPDYSGMLNMIVNADGEAKYKSIEDALKGAAHAQQHIANLEKELAELRTGAEGGKKIEDLVEALKAERSKDPASNNEEDPTRFSPADIQEIVKSTLRDVTTQEQQKKNITKVTSKFRELYGEKASETLYGKAEDLGFDRQDINGLIAKNPDAALKLLGIENKQPKSEPTASSVNSAGLSQHPTPSQPKSSMGFISDKELRSNWLESKNRTLEKLGIKPE